jgi:integrase
MLSFQQEANGKWKCSYEGRRPDGTTYPTCKRGFALKRDAQHWYYKEYLPKLEAQIDMDGEKKTLTGWLDEWLEVYCAKIEDNTYASYKNNIKHVKKALGGFMLCELKQPMIQKFYNEFTMLPNGRGGTMSITMLHRVHNTFNQAMEKALSLGYIKRNPCSGTDRGQVEEKDKLFCTVEQLSAFISLANKSEYYIPLLICAILGVRRGEALGLTWSRIEEGKVKMRAQLTQNNKSGGVSFKEKLKTKRSRRDLDLPPALANEFKKHRRHQLADKLACGEDYYDTDFICTRRGGGPMSPSEMTHEAKRIMTAAGFDPRLHLHNLRGSFATILRKAGVPIEDISLALGHSETRTTEKFYFGDDKEAAASTTCIISDLVGLKTKKINLVNS